MDEDGATLSVGFAIDFHDSFGQLKSLDDLIGTTAASTVRELQRIQAAANGSLNLGGATAEVRSFSSTARSEYNRVEKAGEALARQLERQLGVFGKSKEQIRLMKVETQALAAEQQGITEQAGRLRTLEASLRAKESASIEQAVAARAAITQRAAEAEIEAIRKVNSQLAEQARLEAALEKNTGVGRIRATDAGASFSALSARAAEEEARALRGAAAAHQLFEVRVREGVAAMREHENAERTLAARTLALKTAIDPAYAAQQRFNQEIAEARSLISVGAITLDDYAKRHVQLDQQLKASTSAMDVQAGAVGRQQQGMQQLSFQLNDIATMYASGASASQIFATQSGQVFQALGLLAGGAGAAGKSVAGAAAASDDAGVDIQGLGDQVAGVADKATGMGGKLGAVAGFLSGPWGAAAIAAVAILTPFIAKLFESNNALDDAVDKLKKDAAETETTRQAKELFGRSEEGVAAAIRASTQASKDAATEQRSAAERANIEANANLRSEIAIRRKTQAQLVDTQALMEANRIRATRGGPQGEAVSLGLAGQSGEIDRLQKLITEQADLIRQAEARLGNTRIDLAEEAAKRMADPMERIKKLYLDQANEAKDAARAGIAAGEELTLAQTRQLAVQLAQIERRRQAAVKAENDTRSASRETVRQSGRNIDLIEARRIAESVGGRVTSDHRTRAEQEHLYAKYQAYKAGTGPWAALAARPGTSNHELDQAVDVAKTRGMTLKKLVDAYRAAGVRVVEALDEGSHFHIAWKAVGDQARQQTEAQSAAAKAIADQKRAYEAAVKAADDYITAQANAAAQTGKSAKEIRLMEDAVQRLKAPTDAHKVAIDAAAAAREKAFGDQSTKDFEANIMQPLRDELAMYGLVGPARALAALGLEKEAFVAQHLSDGLDVATARWQEYYAAKSQLIQKDATADREAEAIQRLGDQWDIIAGKVQSAGQGMAEAFGNAGRAIGDLASIYADYHADRVRADDDHNARITKAAGHEQAIAQENARFALRNSGVQIGLFGDMTAAAKGFFKEGSDGYKALATAEKVFRAVEFALSVRAMAQDAAETVSSIAKSGARTATKAVEAVVSAISSLPFPLNLAAGAATVAALASIGVAIAGSFGGSSKRPEANDGTGTVLGDSSAKSESIKRSIDALKGVDTVMLTYSRQMAASLRSIESQIGGFAALVLRTGDVNANGDVAQGFKPNGIGSVLGSIPVIGGILKGLFGTKTKVVGSGLFGGAQSLGDILGGGFDASYYSDIQKKKKFFGLTTSTKYSTKYGQADGGLENQFTLILRQFNDAILAAAGPLGSSTDEIKQKLSGFVVDIGKIDLQGLTGAEIEEKLSAVFGAAADKMATAAFPGFERFQKVGEGLFETLVRVSSTVESVTASLGLLGSSAALMSTDIKVALADQFDSVSDFTGAIDTYFEAYFTKEEQATARTAQFADVFDSLGMSMPGSLAAFRALVEAQDLTSAAGQATYATLLQLAPAFADLQSAMNGAKSAADILAERQDLQRRLLDLQGNTAALRDLDLAQVDESNRALQRQIWAIEDAKEAAAAAQQLREAWTSVGDGIMDEVRRIRGLTDGSGEGSFAALLGRFNAATTAARGGDQDAAGKLVGLSQSLLEIAGNTATSRQELERVKAQTAASLEATYGMIGAITGAATPMSPATMLSAAATAAQAAGSTPPANDDLAIEVRALREEVAQLRSDNNAGHAATSGNTGRIARKLDDVTAASGGDAITVASAA